MYGAPLASLPRPRTLAGKAGTRSKTERRFGDPVSLWQTHIESTDLIRWDLSILYADIADPRLDSDLSELTAMAKHFSLTYKGKLAELLGAAIRDYSEIEMLSGKITSYLFLRESTDLTNAAIKAKHAAFQRELSAIRGEHLTFFELELVQLSDDTLKTFYATRSCRFQAPPVDRAHTHIQAALFDRARRVRPGEAFAI